MIYVIIISLVLNSVVHLGFANLFNFTIIGGMIYYSSKSINEMADACRDNIWIKFFCIWVVYAFCSALWAKDYVLSFQYTYFVLVIGMFFVNFAMYMKDYDENKINNIAKLMAVITLVSCIVGVWEFLTGNHLIEGYLEGEKRARDFQNVPGFTFMNPNDFAMFIQQSIPFSIYLFFIKGNKFFKAISLINIIMAPVIVAITGSRTILIVLGVLYIAVVLKVFNKNVLKITSILVIAVVVMASIPQVREIAENAWEDISVQNLTNSMVDEGASGDTRVGLSKNGILMALHSGGFGQGAGNHRVMMPYYSYEYNYVAGIRAMHNFFVEVLADYGVFIFAFLCILLFKTINRLKKIEKKGENTSLLAYVLRWNAILFVVTAISSSSIVQLTALWITFAFTSVFVQHEYKTIEATQK